MNRITLSVQSTQSSTTTYYLISVESVRALVTSIEYETSVSVFTINSADTATAVITITVSTPPARRARALVEPSATPMAALVVVQSSSASPAIPGPTAHAAQYDDQKLLDLRPRFLERSGGDLFEPVLIRRQVSGQITRTVTAGTTTVVRVATMTITSSYRYTSVYVITTTTYSTSTTILRARVTVTSTTTKNVYQAKSSAQNDPSASATGAPPVDNPSDNDASNAGETSFSGPSSGLSTGAKAGIGGGVAIAAVTILVLALLLWRKRKSNPDDHTVTDAPVATGPHENPAAVAATYYGTDASKSMRSSTVSPPYSPPYSPHPNSAGPGPYVYEATSSDGTNTSYGYPVPGENGQARPHVYEAMVPQGRDGYANSPPAGHSEIYGSPSYVQGQEMYAGSPQMTRSEMYGGQHGQEMYVGMPPQEMGRGTPVVSPARPYGEAWRQ